MKKDVKKPDLPTATLGSHYIIHYNLPRRENCLPFF
jgi:hypothetical protein